MEQNTIKMLETMKSEERLLFLAKKIETYIRKIMIVNDDETVDRDAGFFDLGLDSLTALELKTLLSQDIEGRFELTSTDIFNYPSINKLAKFIIKSLDFDSKADEVSMASSEDRIEKEVETLSEEDIL